MKWNEMMISILITLNHPVTCTRNVSTSSKTNEIEKSSGDECVSGISVIGDKRIFSTTWYEAEYEWFTGASLKTVTYARYVN